MSPSTTETYKNLQIERRGAVTVLLVNRPDVLNALNRETLGEIGEVAGQFVQDHEQGALIVTGVGEKSFISGADINELAVLDPRGAEDISRLGQRVLDTLADSPKPVIAAVNGFAFGGGCELALACHMRLASENAVLGLPEVSLGIIPGYGGTQRLPRLVGPGRALELLLSGRRVKAEEAERIGLVNRVVPAAELDAAAMAFADRLAAGAPLAVRYTKLAVNKLVKEALNVAFDTSTALELLTFLSDDHQEALRAMREKRAPEFRGR